MVSSSFHLDLNKLSSYFYSFFFHSSLPASESSRSVMEEAVDCVATCSIAIQMI